MSSDLPSKSNRKTSRACRPWTTHQNDENAYCPPQTPDRSASRHALLPSTSPNRSNVMRESSNEVSGETESPRKTTYAEKHSGLNRVCKSNGSSEEEENPTSTGHGSCKHNRDASKDNVECITDPTTQRRKESKLSLKKNRQRKYASNRDTSSTSSVSKPKPKSNTEQNSSKKQNSSKPEVESIAEMSIVDAFNSTEGKKEIKSGFSETKVMKISSGDSFSASSSKSDTERTNVQIKSIVQMNTIASIDTSRDTEVTIPIDLLRQFLASVHQQCDIIPNSKSVHFAEATQASHLKEITQSSGDDIDSAILENVPDGILQSLLEDDVEEDPIYVPKVKTNPFSIDIVKKKSLLAPSFPAKPVADCKVSASQKKSLLIKNLHQYAETFQKSTLRRYASLECEQRKDMPKREVMFTNGDVVELYENIVYSLFEPNGNPKWASEVYLQSKEDCEFLNTIFEMFGIEMPPLCGDLGAGLDTLKIIFTELGTFQCEEGTTTRLTQVQGFLHLCRLVEGAVGKVGFCNIEHCLPMIHSKFLSFYEKDKRLAETTFKNDIVVQKALQAVVDAVITEQKTTEFVLKYVQQPALLKAKQRFPTLKIITGSDFSSNNTPLIGIETKCIHDVLQGKFQPSQVDKEFLRKIKRQHSKMSCIDGECHFLKTPHICHYAMSSGVVQEKIHTQVEQDIAKKAHCISKEIEVDYSVELMDIQLYQRGNKQPMTVMDQIKAAYGIIPKHYDEFQKISQARRLKSQRDNALKNGESFSNGRTYISDERLERQRDNALKNGESFSNGRTYISDQLVETRKKSQRDNALKNGESFSNGRTYISDEMLERQLKSQRDNALKNGDTFSNGRTYVSDQVVETRLKSTRNNAIANGEIVDKGKTQSRTFIEKKSIRMAKQGFHVFGLDFEGNREIFLGFFPSPAVLFQSDIVKRNLQHRHICARSDGRGWNRCRAPALKFPIDDASLRIRDKFSYCQIGKDQREFIDMYCETTEEMIRIERILKGDKDWSNCSGNKQLHGVGEQIAPIGKPPVRKPSRKKKKMTASANAKATITPANVKGKATSFSSVSAARNKSKSSGNIPLEAVKKTKKENDIIVLDSDNENKSEISEKRKGNGNLKDDRDYD